MELHILSFKEFVNGFGLSLKKRPKVLNVSDWGYIHEKEYKYWKLFVEYYDYLCVNKLENTWIRYKQFDFSCEYKLDYE